MCPAATGTQTAGSIGRPAAFCGIVGLMPTARRIARQGVFPAAWSLDHVGAFGRTVDDVAALTEAMCGQPLARRRRPTAPRIGLLREFFEEQTDRASWSAHAAFLEELPAHRVELKLPEIFSMALPALWTIMRTEVAATHERLHATHAAAYGAKVRGFIESGLLVPATDYLRARRVRRIYQLDMRRLFDACDILVTPGARGPAPRGLEATGDPSLSAPWTLADFPTLTLPLALDSGGLPLGIQLTAPPMEEPRLLAFARWLESRIAFREAPDLPPDERQAFARGGKDRVRGPAGSR
jgi:Asp-tRNA(Asn)/Glu-tRNA(Gln) amidotransferase A subunit family amidase